MPSVDNDDKGGDDDDDIDIDITSHHTFPVKAPPTYSRSTSTQWTRGLVIGTGQSMRDSMAR